MLAPVISYDYKVIQESVIGPLFKIELQDCLNNGWDLVGWEFVERTGIAILKKARPVGGLSASTGTN